mgnify:CR=1 FL=1
MKIKAAVAFEAAKPLVIEELELGTPKAGEVLVRLAATGVCHTDAYTHERARSRRACSRRCSDTRARASSRRSAPGVTSLAPGDHVIPLYMPECRSCKFCLRGKTNLCSAILRDAGQGPDARRHEPALAQGQDAPPLHGARRRSPSYTVVPEIALAKIRADAPLDKVCLLGCGSHDGHRRGAEHREGRARRDASPCSASAASASPSIQGAVLAGAERIIGDRHEPERSSRSRRASSARPTRSTRRGRRERRRGARRDDRAAASTTPSSASATSR